MKYFLFTTFFLFLFQQLSAFDGLSLIDVRSKGMGDAAVSLPSFYNPAGLSFSETGVLSGNYENRFGLKELSTVTASVYYPNKFLDTGVLYSCFGYEYYNENALVLNISRKLSSYFSLGIHVNYYYLQIAESETNPSTFSADIGMQWMPISGLTIGLMAVNPVFASLNGEKLPSGINTGFSYLVTPKFLLSTEFDKMVDDKPIYKIGVEYIPIQNLFFRMGIYGSPFVPTFGMGYQLKNVEFGLAITNHSTLGLSTNLGLTYLFR